MNAQNAKDYLPLVQALVDGKKLQYQDELGDWLDCPDVMFDKDTPYRIKPQAREWWVAVGAGNNALKTCRNKETLPIITDASEVFEIVHVREVLD